MIILGKIIILVVLALLIASSIVDRFVVLLNKFSYEMTYKQKVSAISFITLTLLSLTAYCYVVHVLLFR